MPDKLRLRGQNTLIAETYFRVAISVAERDQALLQRYLNERAGFLANGLFSQEPHFSVAIEDGSLKGWVKVFGHVFVAAMTTYGAVRAGLDYMVEDAQQFSERVFTDLKDRGIPEEKFLRLERRLGTPGKVRRLVGRIEKLKAHGRDMSRDEYEEAMSRLLHELANTLSEIAEHEETKRIVDAVTETITSDTPQRLPFKDSELDNRIALLPSRRDFLVKYGAGPQGRGDEILKPDEIYRIEKRNGSIQFHPKK